MTERPLLLAVTVLLLLSACGSGEGEVAIAEDVPATSSSTTVAAASTSSTSTTVADTTSTTTLPATTTTEPMCDPSPMEEAAGPATGDGQALAPGCYSTDRLGRGLVVEVAEPGLALFEFPYTFGFARQGTEMSALDIVLVAEFTGVIPSERVGTHPPHDEPIGDHMVEVPSDLATWIEAAPQLVITDSGQYTIDGDPAQWWDIAVDSSAGETFSCSYGACVATLVPSPPDVQGANFVMGDAARFRIVQLSGTGEGLFLWIQAEPESFDDTVALADDIVATLRIVG